MPYHRPVNATVLSNQQKLARMKDYVAHYEIEAALDHSVLDRKVPAKRSHRCATESRKLRPSLLPMKQ